MKGKMPALAFRAMVHIAMPIRNLFHPIADLFAEMDIQPGHHVLDYGCGPGHFTIMAAQQAGPSGKVYALDIHPTALKIVASKADRNQLSNIETILSDCHTSLADDCLDRVLLLDVLHMLENPQAVVSELHRVLRPGACLYCSDHHLPEDRITTQLCSNGCFRLESKGAKTFCFGRL
jgi:ubiquinone/menaquinone biosynthesis C-methylase UbiE